MSTCRDVTHMRYPTAISCLLGLRIVGIDADAGRHGNRQGTVHGGLLCELADAAIGTAHSTLMEAGESFINIDLRATFLRRFSYGLHGHFGVAVRSRSVSLKISVSQSTNVRVARLACRPF